MLQSQTRSPFPRYRCRTSSRNTWCQVAISNEKPVPSLLGISLSQAGGQVGCNLKREARSLATPEGGGLSPRLGKLQSQTRSPFPRYAPAHDIAHHLFTRCNLKREARSLATARSAPRVPYYHRVAISNEKPVPSLPGFHPELAVQIIRCNLKREARSLATELSGNEKENALSCCNLKREARSLATRLFCILYGGYALLQSQTRSPFPRYLIAMCQAATVSTCCNLKREARSLATW